MTNRVRDGAWLEEGAEECRHATRSSVGKAVARETTRGFDSSDIAASISMSNKNNKVETNIP